MARRVGLLGGTFDPPHIAHLVVADQVRDRLGLEEVRLVVSNQSWQKVGERTITPAERRLALVEAAVDGLTGVVASSIELSLGGPSYTAVTVEALEEAEPEIDWLIIVGADAAAGLDTWHRAADLRARRRFVVVNRPGTEAKPPAGWHCSYVEIPSLDLSSTELRRFVASGRSIRHLVTDEVMQRVTRWGLYRQES